MTQRFAKRWELSPGEGDQIPREYEPVRRRTTSEERVLSHQRELLQEREVMQRGRVTVRPKTTPEDGMPIHEFTLSDDREQRLQEQERELSKKREQVEQERSKLHTEIFGGREPTQAHGHPSMNRGTQATQQYAMARGQSSSPTYASQQDQASAYERMQQNRRDIEQEVNRLKHDRERDKSTLLAELNRYPTQSMPIVRTRSLTPNYVSYDDETGPESSWVGGMEGMRDLLGNRMLRLVFVAFVLGIIAIVAIMMLSA